MKLTQQLAKAVRGLYFGGNWTDVSLQKTLEDVDVKMATTQIYELNSILKLTYHIHYYVNAQLGVLKGGALEARDKFAFDHPAIDTEEAWQEMLKKIWQEAEELASLIEQLPEEKIGDAFVDEKYGSYYTNFSGMIEHSHYHLGQIVVLKKMIAQSNS